MRPPTGPDSVGSTAVDSRRIAPFERRCGNNDLESESGVAPRSLEGHVKDGSPGNVTPARVELALSHGYSGSETQLVAAAGSSPKTVEGSAAGGAATSSAYARAGSLHASVQYGQGTLHNSPSKAVWSGGWCGFHSHGLLLLLA